MQWFAVAAAVARRLDREEPNDPALADSPPELFAHLQAEAATTWAITGQCPSQRAR